jgi:hypothetical protein
VSFPRLVAPPSLNDTANHSHSGRSNHGSHRLHRITPTGWLFVALVIRLSHPPCQISHTNTTISSASPLSHTHHFSHNSDNHLKQTASILRTAALLLALRVLYFRPQPSFPALVQSSQATLRLPCRFYIGCLQDDDLQAKSYNRYRYKVYSTFPKN